MTVNTVPTDRAAAWTLEKLVTTPTGELDELFRSAARADAPHRHGVMPAGDSTGAAILGGGASSRRFWAAFARAFCWQGKVFDRTDDDNATLVNKILFAGIKAIKACVYRGPSRLDDQLCIVLDYSQTSIAAKPIRDEIREVSPGVYLGLVYWGKSTRPLLRFALDTNR